MVGFKRLDKLLEVDPLVNLYEKVTEVDKVPKVLGRKMKERGVSAVAV